MPTPAPNITGHIAATGQWQLVAGEGDTTASCNQGYEWLFAAAQPTESFTGHFATSEDWSLPAGVQLYLRASAGTVIVLTAANPLAA